MELFMYVSSHSTHFPSDVTYCSIEPSFPRNTPLSHFVSVPQGTVSVPQGTVSVHQVTANFFTNFTLKS